MAREIERKFLVNDTGFLHGLEGTSIIQAYLTDREEIAVRIRVAGPEGFVTIKSKQKGISRHEFEYEIPVEDANALLELSGNQCISKTRYRVSYQGFLWDVDVFHEANSGLVMAEIELDDEHQAFTLPPWAGKEVTGDKRFYNHELLRNPFSHWRDP